MSSRALRKAQKQREEEEALKRLKDEAAELDGSDEDDEGPTVGVQQSAFALLNAGENEGESDENEEEERHDDAAHDREEHHAATSDDAQVTTSKSKRRKSKKKKKKTVKPSTDKDVVQNDDDIDAALADLAIKYDQTTAPVEPEDPAMSGACALLAVNGQNLRAENEMRRLFGRTALDQHDEEEQPRGQGRRRGRVQQMAGLAAALGRRQGALTGRSSGLASLALRRNPFVQGKEEWPAGTSGGLGMEVVEKRAAGIIEYRFTHNGAYQEVQENFERCVRGMDPEAMIHLLQQHPYHISTLLQVSEIAKQERDNTTSGDLLERALFAFGRSIHSTFSNNLAQGKGRLDFRRPENREFWLAVSRYMNNLSLRATWRTVFEWAKLLLSLDPEDDPYCLRLVIDQYALRAQQPQALIDMAANRIVGKDWEQLPNIQISLGLALMHAGQAAKAKQTLFKAVNKFPWVIAAIFQKINIDPPSGIWGKSPRTDWEKLTSEVYATRAKDIWNTPESSSLLAEVAAAAGGAPDSPIPERAISVDEGRHVILSDKPELIALLPRSITSALTSSSDPLPPNDNIPSYEIRLISVHLGAMGSFPPRRPGWEELRAFWDSLSRLNSEIALRFHQSQRNGTPPSEEDVQDLVRASGLTADEFNIEARRFAELYDRIVGPFPGVQDDLGHADSD